MIPSLVIAIAASAPATRAPVEWLTVAGDPANSAVNTIQVDPVPLELRGAQRIMQIRVSRSTLRTSWDGVPYRSYDSRVMFDCAKRTARYLSVRYFAQPGWAGRALRNVDYQQGEPRWMLFKDVEPNPSQRIVNAACNGALAKR